MQAGVAVDVFWAPTDLESLQPAVLRGRIFFFFSTLAQQLGYLLRFSAFFLGKVTF